MAAILRDESKPISELFPVTLQDPRTSRQYWHESADVAQTVAKELFDKCSQSPPAESGPGGAGGGAMPYRPRVSEVEMSLGKLMGHPAVTGGREQRVDVDDVLWLFMKHWLVGSRGAGLVFALCLSFCMIHVRDGYVNTEVCGCVSRECCKARPSIFTIFYM